MITTVTLNPCIDKTVIIDELIAGGMNRIKSNRMDASGKGINVAIVYHGLGGKALCTGINYRTRGELIIQRLDEHMIEHDFVMVDGEVRVNLKIYDEQKGHITEVNECGHPVNTEAISRLKQKIAKYAAQSGFVVFSGSIPKGIKNNIYKELIDCAAKFDTKIVLDAEGELLQQGLKAQPYLLKPNLYELEMSLGRVLKTHNEIVKGARQLLDFGVSIIGISLGKEGAIIVNESEAYYAPALAVDVKSTVGAGDSMVAAFCMAIEKEYCLKDTLRMGMAVAASTVMCEGTQLYGGQEITDLIAQVQIETINA